MTQSAAATDPEVAWHALAPRSRARAPGRRDRAGPDRRRGREPPRQVRRRTGSPMRPRSRAGRRSSASTRTRCRSCCWRPASSACSCRTRSPTGVVLIGLTLLNAAMGLSQEGKASASVAALQKMMVVKAKVRRDGALVEVPMEELVPGDIVNIEAGDLVPADGRILTAATLEIDESALTGESVPVPKQVDAGRGRRGARRPGRPRVHEHAGHPRRRHDPRRRHRHDHRGRPHQRHAPGDQGRGHAAHPAAQLADQPDPAHRRHRAGASRSASGCGGTRRSTSCS